MAEAVKVELSVVRDRTIYEHQRFWTHRFISMPFERFHEPDKYELVGWYSTAAIQWNWLPLTRPAVEKV